MGDLPVVAALSMGFERLTLFFTDRRIIVSRQGKTGAGAVPATFMFGSVGSALSGLFRGGSRGSSKQKSRYPSPERVLSSDKDNFSILFSDIVSVDLTRTLTSCEIVLLSRDDKFDFTCRSKYNLIRSLFETSVGAKLSLHQKD